MKYSIWSMKRIFLGIISIALYSILSTLYPTQVKAANCDPNGGIDPATWIEIEACTADDSNPGNYGQEWVCFGDDGTPQAKKFSFDSPDPSCGSSQSTPQGDLCTYPENCDAGGGLSSGQWACTGTIQEGSCKFDPAVLPHCGPTCEPINSPSPSASTESQAQPSAPSTEEQAVYNQCKLTSPNGVCPTPQEEHPNFFQQLLNAIKNLFLFPAQKPNKLYNQSLQLHQNNFPKELQPDQGNKSGAIDQSLGTTNGHYSIGLPASLTTTSSQDKDICQKEKLFEQSNFPPGVAPITNTNNSDCTK